MNNKLEKLKAKIKFKTKEIVISLIFLVFVLFTLLQIFNYSATFDEPLHLTAGVSYIQDGRLDINEGHPPLSKYISGSILSLFSKREIDYSKKRDWEIGNDFFLHNKFSSDTILILGRLPSLLVGILFFIFLFKLFIVYFKKRSTAVLGIFFFSITPIFITPFAIANSDYLLYFFSLITIYIFIKPMRDEKKLYLLILFSTLGFMSKFSGITLYLFSLIQFFKLKNKLKALLISILIGFFVILLAYQFKPHYLYSSVFYQMEQISEGKSLYFLGHNFKQGSPLFIFDLFFKLSIFYIPFFIFGRKFFNKKNSSLIIYLLLNVFLFAISKKQLGIRYLLPGYTIFLIWALSGIEKIFLKSKILIYIILGIMFLFVVRDLPNLLSYFNEIIPVNKRYRISVDSDLNWGQELKFLEKWTKRHPGNYTISYFGTDEPTRFFNCKNLYSVSYGKRFTNSINNIKYRNNYLMVSATNLSGKYYPYFDYLKEKKPIKTINGSFFIFKY
jgi:hypothetical protein